MARPRGAKKLKSIEQLITENEIQIQETEELLKSLKEEQKVLKAKKEEEDVVSLLNLIKESGLSVAEAKEYIVKKGQE